MIAWIRRGLALGLPIALVFGAIVAFGAMGALKPKAGKKAEEPRGIAVFVEPARRETVSLSVKTQGEVRPRTEIDVVPQVSGKVTFVSEKFLDGASFAKNDVLMRIEDADYKLAVTRADAEVARARRAFDTQKAEADIAARDWAEIGEGEASALALRAPQLAEARAALAGAEASLADAKLHLERTVIKAPFDGRVRQKIAGLGQYVTPGQKLGRIFATDIVEVRLAMADADLALLGIPLAFVAAPETPGPAVTLTHQVAGVERKWRAAVARTDAAVDAATRTLSVIAEVHDPYGAGADDGAPLAVGLFVDAQIEGRTVADAYVLPRPALRAADQVFVATPEGSLSMRTVKVASSDRQRVIVTAGVSEGEHVITSPLVSAVEGMKVEAYSRAGELLFPKRPEEKAEDADTPAANGKDAKKGDKKGEKKSEKKSEEVAGADGSASKSGEKT